jgi:hypothetical protein
MAFSVMPVILTCEMELAVTRRFVLGFCNVQYVLKPPIVLIDQSGSPRLSGEYLALISSMNPAAVYIHPREAAMKLYDSVQEAANRALELALQDSSEEDYILFLEDDIAFSSHFAEKVINSYLGPETGFLTLYTPGDEYGFHIVEPSRFYGTQCLLFTRKAVEEIVLNRNYMMANFPPGYDIRWSRFLAHKDYVLYCTDYSYVQHLPSISRLHGQGSHTSNRFLP